MHATDRAFATHSETQTASESFQHQHRHKSVSFPRVNHSVAASLLCDIPLRREIVSLTFFRRRNSKWMDGAEPR